MEGSPQNYKRIRAECVQFLKKFRDQFAPFLETEDQTFEDYCDEMAADGEWGGHAELQAMSLGYEVNIVIHQLDKPRWEIVNFPSSQKTIHLAYHNGEHYSSVRPREGHKLPPVGSVSHPPDEFQNDNNSNNDVYGLQGADYLNHAEEDGVEDNYAAVAEDVIPKSTAKNTPAPSKKYPDEVALVMAATDCGDPEMVMQTLVENLYDVQAAIDYIVLLQQTNDGHSMPKARPAAPSPSTWPSSTTPKVMTSSKHDNKYDSRTDAEIRATQFDNGDHGDVRADDGLAVYKSGGSKGASSSKSSKGGKEKERVDPNVELARQIVELEHKKNLSNKERKELNQLRKRANAAGLDVETLAGSGNRRRTPSPTVASVMQQREEDALDELADQVKDLGALAI